MANTPHVPAYPVEESESERVKAETFADKVKQPKPAKRQASSLERAVAAKITGPANALNHVKNPTARAAITRNIARKRARVASRIGMMG